MNTALIVDLRALTDIASLQTRIVYKMEDGYENCKGFCCLLAVTVQMKIDKPPAAKDRRDESIADIQLHVVEFALLSQ